MLRITWILNPAHQHRDVVHFVLDDENEGSVKHNVLLNSKKSRQKHQLNARSSSTLYPFLGDLNNCFMNNLANS